MQEGASPELLIQGRLEILGVSSLEEWDVLVFLYRHRASLTNAEQVASLLGYSATVVGDALTRLTNLKLVKRSRPSEGVRLYQFVGPAHLPHRDSFKQLFEFTANPAGRRLLLKKLRRHSASKQRPGGKGLHLTPKGGARWPRAM
jgi:DNA-binding transcriptional ArsR family regulator